MKTGRIMPPGRSLRVPLFTQKQSDNGLGTWTKWMAESFRYFFQLVLSGLIVGEYLWPCCPGVCPHLQGHQCGEFCPGRTDDAGRLLLLLSGIHLSYSLYSRLSDHPGFFIPPGHSHRNGHSEGPWWGEPVFSVIMVHSGPVHPFAKPGWADLGA